MKLPNAENAIVERDKLVLYLLNVEHSRGGSKAKLLHSLGFDIAAPEQLADQIRQQHVPGDVIEERETIWGPRYDIVAPLTGPTGDTVLFHSVWQIDLGTDRPRLITIYPE